MLSLKLKLLCVLAISPLALGISDPLETLLSGDYDPATLMNSMHMILGSTVKMLLTEKDDIPDISQDVTFWCSNQQRQVAIKTFVNDTNMATNVDLEKPFTFIVHGWTDNGNRTWIKNLTSSYWEFVDTNVCVVDWHRLANYEYNIASKRNTKTVGKYIAEFIKSLVERKVDLDDVTVVGHSLGGQIAGYTGAALDGQLGTIYGLDPAGPSFTHPIMHGPADRLDSSDAKYVQVIFTTKGLLGSSVACGHQNFFPNGGTNVQSGCLLPLLNYGYTPTPLTCSHLHATVLFRYSLDPKQAYTGSQCESNSLFHMNMCLLKTKDRMGIYSTRIYGNYYLSTSPLKPFKQTHLPF